MAVPDQLFRQCATRSLGQREIVLRPVPVDLRRATRNHGPASALEQVGRASAWLPLLAPGVHPGDGRLPGRALAGGSAHTAEGAEEWLAELVERLRGVGVGDITVRLDKGFFSRDMVRTLERLGVSFLLKVPATAG